MLFAVEAFLGMEFLAENTSKIVVRFISGSNHSNESENSNVWATVCNY